MRCEGSLGGCAGSSRGLFSETDGWEGCELEDVVFVGFCFSLMERSSGCWRSGSGYMRIDFSTRRLARGKLLSASAASASCKQRRASSLLLSIAKRDVENKLGFDRTGYMKHARQTVVKVARKRDTNSRTRNVGREMK